MVMMMTMIMRDNDENKVEREWQRTCDRRRQLVFCSPVTHCQNVTTVDLYYIHLTCISLQFSLLYFSVTFLYFTSSVPCRTLSKWLRPPIIALHCTVMNRLSQCHIFTLLHCHNVTFSHCHNVTPLLPFLTIIFCSFSRLSPSSHSITRQSDLLLGKMQ